MAEYLEIKKQLPKEEAYLDPIFVILDTSALRKEVSAAGQALERLREYVEKGVVQVLVPELVLRELATQFAVEWKKWQHKGEKDPQKVLSWCASGEVTATLESALAHVTAFSEHVDKLLEEGVKQRLDALNARILPVTEASARTAWEMYFAGTGPMKQAKNREDIPDAFIVAIALEAQARLGKRLHFVSGDGPMKKGMPVDKFVLHDGLGSFNSSEEVLTARKAIEKFADDQWRTRARTALAEQQDAIESNLNDALDGALKGETITSRFLPSDNNDAELTGDGVLEKLDLALDAVDYLGREAVFVPGTLHVVDALADIYIYKSDYWSDDKVVSHFKAWDANWNDHYVAAEGYLDLIVQVLIRVDLSEDEEGVLTVSEVSIENVESINVKEPKWQTERVGRLAR